MIYGSIRAHTGPYGPIFVARGEKNQMEKVKIHISDRDFFLGLVQRNLDPNAIRKCCVAKSSQRVVSDGCITRCRST